MKIATVINLIGNLEQKALRYSRAVNSMGKTYDRNALKIRNIQNRSRASSRAQPGNQMYQRGKAVLSNVDKAYQRGKTALSELDKTYNRGKKELSNVDKAYQSGKRVLMALDKMYQGSRSKGAPVSPVYKKVKGVLTSLDKAYKSGKGVFATIDKAYKSGKGVFVALNDAYKSGKGMFTSLQNSYKKVQELFSYFPSDSSQSTDGGFYGQGDQNSKKRKDKKIRRSKIRSSTKPRIRSYTRPKITGSGKVGRFGEAFAFIKKIGPVVLDVVKKNGARVIKQAGAATLTKAALKVAAVTPIGAVANVGLTAYELGSAFEKAFIGGKIGSWIYDVTHPKVDVKMTLDQNGLARVKSIKSTDQAGETSIDTGNTSVGRGS